jgi:hypothetical protein
MREYAPKQAQNQRPYGTGAVLAASQTSPDMRLRRIIMSLTLKTSFGAGMKALRLFVNSR